MTPRPGETHMTGRLPHSILPPLCLSDRTFAPFGRYAVEMLLAEGLTGAAERDVSAAPVSLADLLSRQAIVLAPCQPERGAEETVLAALAQGAGVVFLRPSAGTARTLGFAPLANRTAQECYLLPEQQHPLAFPALGEALQFHGTADLYETPADRGSVCAWIGGREWATRHPAVVTGTYGAGRFVLFTYDLATSTVLFHQGRRAQASTGPHPDPDGDHTYTPNDLFVGYRDRSLLHLPQADLQQQLLIRALAWVSEPVGPLVRLWPFPHAAPALALVNGDSDGMTRPQMEWYVNMTEAHGGGYTIYLLAEHLPLLPPALEEDYRRRGHSAGPHVWLNRMPTPEAMATHPRGSGPLPPALRVRTADDPPPLRRVAGLGGDRCGPGCRRYPVRDELPGSGALPVRLPDGERPADALSG